MLGVGISSPTSAVAAYSQTNLVSRPGQDRYHPVSEHGSQMSPKGLGWIIVDSLSTMMVMNLSAPLAESRKWLQRSLTYDQDQDVNTFETTIRMLGGLLSAHYLATRFPDVSSRRDSVYMAKATDLAERLLSAYESPSGIPYASVHLAKKVGIPSHDGGASSMAEAATLQLEMKYLSYLTHNETYWRKAEKVMQVLDDNRAEAGLLPIYVHPHTGRFTSREIRLGSRGDSYYGELIGCRALCGGLLTRHRILDQAVSPDVRPRAHLPRYVGGSPGRYREASHYADEEGRAEDRCRVAQRYRRQPIAQDGPPRLLPPRVHSPRRNRWPHRRRST